MKYIKKQTCAAGKTGKHRSGRFKLTQDKERLPMIVEIAARIRPADYSPIATLIIADMEDFVKSFSGFGRVL